MCFGVLPGYAEIDLTRAKDDPFDWDGEPFDFVMLPGVEDPVSIESQLITEVDIVAVATEALAAEGLDDNVSALEGIQNRLIGEDHVFGNLLRCGFAF